MPSLEFWFTGSAVFGAVSFLYSLVVGAMGINQKEARWYKGLVYAIVPLFLIQWFLLAKQEEDKTKPARDYVYFVPSSDPRMAHPDGVVLFTQSTGVIRDVHFAIERTENYVSHNDNYYSFGRIPIIDEGLNGSSFALPPGDWNIDIDPPTKLGKVRERIIIVKTGISSFETTIWVSRKDNGEQLYPLPEPMAAQDKVILAFVLLGFAAFIIPLSWVSR